MLQFLSQWLAREPPRLGASVEEFVGHPAYGITQLRQELKQFVFLLGGSDGEPSSARTDSLPGMAAWDELKVVLARLHDEQPDALTGYPAPWADEGRAPPFPITLAPWATAAAEELHRQFGHDVELTVGALPYLGCGTGHGRLRLVIEPRASVHGTPKAVDIK